MQDDWVTAAFKAAVDQTVRTMIKMLHREATRHTGRIKKKKALRKKRHLAHARR